MTQVVELYSDGACRGNPGPGGWGVVLRYGRHEKQLFGGEHETTNNRMELMAVIRGLQSLTKRSRVKVTTDSQYVKNGITQWIYNWKRNGWRTAAKRPVKNADLWQMLDTEVNNHQVEWAWVKGHSGHTENELADELANRGIEELGLVDRS
ncbi:ribonuclease HI [Candidatus Thiodiazotropha sp. LNASS1]|uniref:ribonuclease HI n=1 Tax=Candidatus Thiodiazotropha sp. LNASS1 TaxID=3096260 RepID=UPI0034DEEF34